MKKKCVMATPPAEVGSNHKKQKNDMWESVVVEDEFAVDDSFLKECAERLDEAVCGVTIGQRGSVGAK
jgi:hypothetical protein